MRVFDPFELATGGVDPYPVYRELRDDSPVHHNAERGFWALSRFEDVRAASRDWPAFSNAAGVDLDELGLKVFGPGDFLDMDPPEHDELRAVVKSRFTPKSVAELEPLVRVEVAALLAELPARQRFDAVEFLAWPLPNNVMCGVLGIPPSDRRQVARLYRTVMERVPGDETIPPTALAAAAELRAYLLDLAEHRRRRPLADVMTAIATAEVGGARLSERKVVGMAFVLLSAGIDTVASLLGNALLLLALHPEQCVELSKAPERLPDAIEEALRFESPLQFNARITSEAVEVQGAAIPAGERVLLLYGAANRDERRFPDPDRFDISREPRRHLAFGEGIHFCIGAALARLETRVALSAWLAAMPSYALDGQPERMPAYNMRSLRRLPVAVGG